MRYSAHYVVPVALVTMTLMASCTDLTEVPYSEITSANFNPTGDNIGSLIAPAYTTLRPLWMTFHGNIDLQEATADSYVTPVRPDGWYDGGTFIRLHKHMWNAVQGQVANLWNNCYNGINSANRVIHQIESGKVQLAEDAKQRVLAELKALRAYYYYLLMDGFGNVPIVTDFTAEELPDQNTRQEVYNFVVDQLTTHIPELSEAADMSMYGRINKWTGKAILADVYLNAEVYTGTSQYEEVISVTNDVISSGKYQLDDNYLDQFDRNNQNSTGNMWVVPYDEVNAPDSHWHMKNLKTVFAITYDMQAQPWAGSAAVPQFIHTYGVDDTRMEDTWFIGPLRDDGGKVLMDIPVNIPGINSDQTKNSHGATLIKYEIYAGMTSSTDVDFPIYRYADVLMMKAEALLRTGSPDQAAELVTQVRERAFAETDPSKAKVTGAELMGGSTYTYGWWEDGHVVNAEGGADIKYGRFLDELGWEFAMEGHRRQDLIRFGVFTTKTWFNHKPNGDYRTLFPIPLEALNTNTKLKQNPGY